MNGGVHGIDRRRARRIAGWAPAIVAGAAVCAAAAPPPPATVSAHPYPLCVTAPSLLVRIDLTGAAAPVVGGQFFLEYDPTMLWCVGATVGSAPFTTLVYQHIDNALGRVDVATGVSGAGPGTSADTTMAVVQFVPLQQGCNLTSLVRFRAHNPPTRLTTLGGTEVPPATVDSPRMIIDGPPLFPCRVDMDVNGVIEPVDIALFVNLWLTSVTNSTLEADFDFSGFVEPADIAAFVNAWLAAIAGGC